MKADPRQLKDLVSVGPAMLRDFELLGIRSVRQLRKQQAQALYERLGRVAGEHQDLCVLDCLRAAIAQARNPLLPAAQAKWWWWSSKRKAARKSPRGKRG